LGGRGWFQFTKLTLFAKKLHFFKKKELLSSYSIIIRTLRRITMGILSVIFGIGILIWNIYATVSNAKNGFPIMALLGVVIIIAGIYGLAH
jgi:multidrug transporter EmrE-like cation transporter